MLIERWFKTYNLRITTYPYITYPCPLMKRFHSGSIYVALAQAIGSDMSAKLWNVTPLYIEDHL